MCVASVILNDTFGGLFEHARELGKYEQLILNMGFVSCNFAT